MTDHPYRDNPNMANPRFVFTDDAFVDLEAIYAMDLISNDERDDAGDWIVRFKNNNANEEVSYDPETGAKIFAALKEYRR